MICDKNTTSSFAKLEQQLEHMLDAQTAFSYCCENNKDWHMHQIDDNCKQVTGVDANHILAHDITFGSLIHVDDQQRCWDIVQNAITTNKPFQSMYRLVMPNNQIKLVYEHGVGIYKKSGKLKEIRGYISDASAQNNIFIKNFLCFDFDLCINELLELSKKMNFRPSHHLGKITHHEIRIVMHACLGKTMKEIATELSLSPRTIEMHINRVKKKLGCVSTSQLKSLMLKTKHGKHLVINYLLN